MARLLVLAFKRGELLPWSLPRFTRKSRELWAVMVAAWFAFDTAATAENCGQLYGK
jgi:hypothetical protein